MEMKLKVAAISAGLLIGSSAFAQDNLVDYLVESCQTELETICGDVQVGEGPGTGLPGRERRPGR